MKKIVFISTIMMLSSLLFTGCLKDDPLTDYNHIDPIILIPNGNWPSNNPPTPLSYLTTDGPQEIKIYARVSWEGTLDHDLKVTFVKDEAVIGEFNTMWGSTYAFMPDNGYSMSSMQVTIPKNTREATIPITITPGNLAPFSDYMLAFTISDAEEQVIAKNFKTILIPVQVQ